MAMADTVSGAGSARLGDRIRHRVIRAVMARRMPLARQIIAINLLTILVLIAGVVYLSPFRDTIVLQREAGLVAEAELVADVFEARLSDRGRGFLTPGAASETLGELDLGTRSDAFVFGADGALLASTVGMARTASTAMETLAVPHGRTAAADTLDMIRRVLAGIAPDGTSGRADAASRHLADELVASGFLGETRVETGFVSDGGTIFAVATPIMLNGGIRGVLAMTSGAGEIDRLVRWEREQALRLFFVAVLFSVSLSFLLASTIARPLTDLAAAAETGQDRTSRPSHPSRVKLPDMSGRADEIGRLSTALQGMVEALYVRIDANEQFAADVAHEIKNPLASLRSATTSLRRVTRTDHRDKLLDVIDDDVRRLDRLVSDISDASRLDSELVKEQEESFDLSRTLSNLAEHLGAEAGRKGIRFHADLPDAPMTLYGLESRLSQVFVNLLGNAISFCGPGDAIRLWARQRHSRILVVIEDTGPGIPEAALTKIFDRFYSHRPDAQFGNNSGLGLAISKQIVEAHGGVIWAENIAMPGEFDTGEDPLGARFVVGLPA